MTLANNSIAPTMCLSSKFFTPHNNLRGRYYDHSKCINERSEAHRVMVTIPSWHRKQIVDMG